MTLSVSSPGEGMAPVIPFPERPRRSTRPAPSSWQGALVDLDQARNMAQAAAATADSDQTLADQDSTAARATAIRALATKGRSVHEMRQRLVDRGVDPVTVETEVSRLIDEGLLDDDQLARDLASRLQERKKLGPQAIRQALLTRQIPRAIIDEVVGEIALSTDALEDLARSRLRHLQGLSPEVASRRLVSFLARRGYSGPAVYSTVSTLLAQH